MSLFSRGYALIVGISDYAYVSGLPTTIIQDAQNVSSLLRDPAYCAYPETQVRILLDGQATTAGFRAALQWLAAECQAEDTAVLYFSGHGGRPENGDLSDNYLILQDTNPANLAETAVSGTEFTHLLQQIRANRLLVLFDCCHAGGVGQVSKDRLAPKIALKSGLDESLYDRLGQGRGRAIIASSRSDELSYVLPGMANSLFTHYLLDGLRGQAPTRGDGLLRLFDLFDYLSQNVNQCHPAQHPILKAELEDNFPIALYVGGKRVGTETAVTSPLHEPNLQNPLHLPLEPVEKAVLVRLFAGYERVVLKQEFGGGFGGGRVLLLRPIRTSGAELPAVVKLGPAAIIDQEWQAFADVIERKVPNVARIEGEPVYGGDGWGGIRYPLVGDGRFYTESLNRFCQHAPAADVRYVLEQRLFPAINALWQTGRVEPELFVGDALDPILPVNLIVRATSPATPLAGTPLSLTPETVRQQQVAPGSQVTLSGFVVTEVDQVAGELTLDLPESGGPLPARYRLRVKDLPDLTPFQPGHVLPHPLTGMVQTTRLEILQDNARQAFDGAVDVTAEPLTLPELGPLPNALLALPQILNRTIDMRIGPIHGDLNLENILVESDRKSHIVHLIDFANARQDWVLHDLWRLETGIWLYVAAREMQENGRSLADLPPVLVALHNDTANPLPAWDKVVGVLTAVRQMARSLLVNNHTWDEYYQGLIVYLLGALKFKNLDTVPTAPLPKQLALVVAALLVNSDQFSVSSEPVVTTNGQVTVVKDRPSEAPSQVEDTMTLPEIMRQIRLILQDCEPFESHRELRAFFAQHPQLKPWRNRLPEEHRLTARVDGTVALLHNRTHAPTNTNALVLLLHILSEDPNIDEAMQPQLADLAAQLERVLANNI
jgi:hypothetical protein